MPIKSVLPIKEDDIQRTVVEGLRALGFIVLITSRRRKKCLQCGSVDTRGDGVSEGVPDLIVTHQAWHPYAWMGIEMKGPTTKLSDEQKVLEGAGRIAICRSWEDAAVAIWRAWPKFGGFTSVPSALTYIAKQAGEVQRKLKNAKTA